MIAAKRPFTACSRLTPLITRGLAIDMRNVSRTIVRALSWLSLGGWLVVIACAISSPVAPNPVTGHTVPMNNHGTIHYVTPLVHYLLFWYIPALIVIGLLLKRSAWWKRHEDI
jgi:hypothetical protein